MSPDVASGRLTVAAAVAFAVALAAGCSRLPDTPPASGRAEAVRELCGDRNAVDFYFPSGRLEPRSQSADLERRNTCSAILRAMSEGSLSCGPSEAEEYRLTRLEYTGVPVATTVKAGPGSPIVRAVKLEAPTWLMPPGHIILNTTRRVAPEEWDAREVWSNRVDFGTLRHSRTATASMAQGPLGSSKGAVGVPITSSTVPVRGVVSSGRQGGRS
jgi:hypothetical protein